MFVPPYNRTCKQCQKEFGTTYIYDEICYQCSNPEIYKVITMKEEIFTLMVERIDEESVLCYVEETKEMRTFEKVLFQGTPLSNAEFYKATIKTGIGSLEINIKHIPRKILNEKERINAKWNKIYSRFKEDIFELTGESNENNLFEFKFGENIYDFELIHKEKRVVEVDDLPF